MTPMNRHSHIPIFISVFVLILSFQHASADSVKNIGMEYTQQ